MCSTKTIMGIETAKGEYFIMAKMGRPKVEDPRKKSIGVRLTNDEYKAIKEYVAKRNMTITEAVLEGLRNVIAKPAK